MWIALVTGILMTLITAITLPIAFRTSMDRIWGPIITGIAATVAFVSAYISSRNRPTLGSGILISVILFLQICNIPFRQQPGHRYCHHDYILGLHNCVFTSPPTWITRVTVISIVLGLANILADFYLPNFGLPSDPRYTNVIATILSAIYIFITLRQFNQYSLRSKLICFSFWSLFSRWAPLPLLQTAWHRTEITQQVGRTNRPWQKTRL